MHELLPFVHDDVCSPEAPAPSDWKVTEKFDVQVTPFAVVRHPELCAVHPFCSIVSHEIDCEGPVGTVPLLVMFTISSGTGPHVPDSST